MKQRLLLAIAVLLAAVAGGAYYALARDSRDSASQHDAVWAINLVHVAVFGSGQGADVGCFTARPGHKQTTVFVVDSSYKTFQPVDCYDDVWREGDSLRVSVRQAWDATAPPDGSNPVSWVQKFFYKPASHTWSYLVHRNGKVDTLPETGIPVPQSYAH